MRACLGCLDEDLKYAHSSCLNQYINNLPCVNDVTAQGDVEMGLWEALMEQYDASHLPMLDFKCTRCLDTYLLEVKYGSRFNTLVKEQIQVLIALIGLFLISLLIFFASYLSIQYGPDYLRSPIPGLDQVSTKLWSYSISIVYIIINVTMWMLVLSKLPPYRYVQILSKE